MNRHLALAFAALVLAAPAAAHEAQHAARPELEIGRSIAYDYDPPEPGSYRLPALKPAADGPVLDHLGRTLRLGELLQGRLTVMAFIYTRCADVCPLATMLLHDLHGFGAADPVLGEALQLVTISFDPERDTPAAMAEQASQVSAGAPWHFLTTTDRAALRPLLDAYGQTLARNGDEYAHQLRVFLIDRQARIRNIYSVGFMDPRLVATDLRSLLIEEDRVARR